LAELCHRLAGENFNIQPNLKLSLVRPDFAYLWPGISIDHQRNIKAARAGEKRFVLLTPRFSAVRRCAGCSEPLQRFSAVIPRAKPLKRFQLWAVLTTSLKRGVN
jgi:hypothetical protein